MKIKRKITKTETTQKNKAKSKFATEIGTALTP
jgi:hypothetical protein